MSEKCRSYDVELARAQRLAYDAQSAAGVATRTVDSLCAELTAVKQSRDELLDELSQARQLLRQRTESVVHHFSQSIEVEVSICIIVVLL